MAGVKSLELAFRSFLLGFLGAFVKRHEPFPHDIDFSSCKILFVRQDRIGDVLVSTPLVHALKKAYPSIILDFLLSSNNHFVLASEPRVRTRWVYRKTLLSAIQVLRNVRKEKYEFVVDLMDNPSATSTVLCLLAGARWNVGLAKGNAYVYDVVVPMPSRQTTHIVDRLAALLNVFNLRPEEVELRVHYATTPESRERASRFFHERGLTNKRVIGVNISPGKGTRFWGTRNYQRLLSELRSGFKDFRIMVLYQPSDQAIASEIVSPVDGVTLSPLTPSFDDFAALIERLTVLITPDTSAVHLAAAFNLPAVVMYVQSDPTLRIWEPYGSQSETLVTPVDDLTTIPVADVLGAISRLLGVPSGLSDHPNSSGRHS
jgi:ADP-heptose:LPS heptosyltransferase